MFEEFKRPRLTRYDDVALVVAELRKVGVSSQNLYHQIIEFGPVDLDLLSEVLRREPQSA